MFDMSRIFSSTHSLNIGVICLQNRFMEININLQEATITIPESKDSVIITTEDSSFLIKEDAVDHFELRQVDSINDKMLLVVLRGGHEQYLYNSLVLLRQKLETVIQDVQQGDDILANVRYELANCDEESTLWKDFTVDGIK